jgi:hypothetical protein
MPWRESPRARAIKDVAKAPTARRAAAVRMVISVSIVG